MNFQAAALQIDAFLYRKAVQKLTPEDLENARIWSLDLIRKNHPTWSENEVECYYHSLLNVRTYVVDEWGRRMR